MNPINPSIYISFPLNIYDDILYLHVLLNTFGCSTLYKYLEEKINKFEKTTVSFCFFVFEMFSVA